MRDMTDPPAMQRLSLLDMEPRPILAVQEGAKCGRAADLAAEFYAGYCGLQIVGIRQIICVNLNGGSGSDPIRAWTAIAFPPFSLMPATTASAPDLCQGPWPFFCEWSTKE